MIVRDEEATLADCLESVRELVDEMIIVDTGSTDRTISIAQDAGAKVISVDWNNDFSAARNQALEQVQTNWVLVLDADEVLVPGIAPALKLAMEDENCLVVNLVRQELGANQVPYSLVSRLFRKHPAIAFRYPYHESIDDSVVAILANEPHWKVLELAEIAIRHSGYTTEAIAQRNKQERARTIMEGYLAHHPGDPYLYNKLGALYLDAGEAERGRDLLHQGLQNEQIEPAIRYELHYHLASYYSQIGDFDKAEQHFQAAAEQPVSAYLKLGAYTNWGNLRMQQENAIAAQVLFQKVVEIDPRFALGFYNLATAFKATGKLNEAVLCYQNAIELDPTYAEAHQGLGVTYMKGGRILESLDSFRRAISLYEQQGSPEAERLQQVLREMNLG